MLRLLFISSIFFLFASTINAEHIVEKKDSLVARRIITRFLLNLDTRGSLVHNVPVQIAGIKVGIQLRKRHRLGLGFYLMGVPVFGQTIFGPVTYDVDNVSHKNVVVKDKPTHVNTVESDESVSLSMVYGSVFYEYVILTHKRWEITLPVQLGFGEATYTSHVLETTTNPITNKSRITSYDRPNDREFIFLGESSLNVQFKMVCWLGVGGGLGYRRLFNDNNNPQIADTFDNVIWIAKVKLFPLDLWKVFKGKQKWYKVY